MKAFIIWTIVILLLVFDVAIVYSCIRINRVIDSKERRRK